MPTDGILIDVFLASHSDTFARALIFGCNPSCVGLGSSDMRLLYPTKPFLATSVAPAGFESAEQTANFFKLKYEQYLWCELDLVVDWGSFVSQNARIVPSCSSMITMEEGKSFTTMCFFHGESYESANHCVLSTRFLQTLSTSGRTTMTSGFGAPHPDAMAAVTSKLDWMRIFLLGHGTMEHPVSFRDFVWLIPSLVKYWLSTSMEPRHDEHYFPST